MRVRYRPEAGTEVLEARQWYEVRSPGLGLEFARAVDAAIAAISRQPGAYPKTELGCQRFLVRRFPYAIVYQARSDELLIVACFHHRRKPGAWKGRAGK